MSDTFKLEIVNPEKSFLVKENVTEVVIPAFEGEMGILKDHISIISFLKPGVLKVLEGGSEEKKYYVEDQDNDLDDQKRYLIEQKIEVLKSISTIN